MAYNRCLQIFLCPRPYLFNALLWLVNRYRNGVIVFPTYCNPQLLQLIKYTTPSESQWKRWLMQKDRPSTWLLIYVYANVRVFKQETEMI
jgi:hypothetical protein